MGNINDFNLTSGTDVLSLPYAESYLYDASSFYNYEQDNIPIDRLLRRTDLLHQFHGFPGVQGKEVTMTLSATADHSIGVYDNFDDIVNRIPQRLTFPLYIEICDFGNLGTLDLFGITTVGEGQLHIDNKLHTYDADCTVTAVASRAISPASATQDAPYRITTTTARDYIEGASSTRTGASIFDNSQLVGGGGRMFVTKNIDTEDECGRLHFYEEISIEGAVGSSDVLSGTPYVSAVDETIGSYDLEAIGTNGQGQSLETSRDVLAVSDGAAMNLYGNYFQAVNIRDCHGSIKLTGVCVDTASGADNTASPLVYNENYGMNINSSEIILEHTAAIRARLAGIMCRNSELCILGSLIGYRNYERDSDKTRALTTDSAGVHAVNSTLVFTNTALGTDSDADFNRFTMALSRNEVGMILDNSKVTGGVRVTSGKGNAGGTDLTTSVLQAYQNTKDGFRLKGSDMSFLGRLDSYNNLTGVSLKDSTMNLPQLTVDDNQLDGICMVNSLFEYAYRVDELASADRLDGDTTWDKNKGAYHVSNNGVNLRASHNSIVRPHYTGLRSLPSYLGRWTGNNGGANFKGAMSNHGSKTGVLHDEPGIIVSDNSTIEIINASFKADADAPVRGKCVHVLGNSKASMRGSAVASLIASLVPDSGGNFTLAGINDSFQTAAFCAEKNSEIEITGPTKISRFGIAVMAEDNSVATLQTPTADGGTVPESEKYELSATGNQTKIEIHSTRSCIVVNKSSGLNMRNIGGDAETKADTVDLKFNSGAWADTDLSDAWSGVQQYAYVQFYPNPFTTDIIGEGFHEAVGSDAFTATTRLIASGSEGPMCGGGMAVRAVQGSYVDIDAVNFNFSMPASSVSGVISNVDGLGIEGSGNIEWGPTVTASDKGYTTIANIPQGTDPYTGEPLFDSGGSEGYTTIFSSVSAFDSYAYEGYVDPCSGYYDPSSMGTRVQIFNIADDSRIHAANVRLNEGNPSGISDASSFHGPLGKWPNGVALDYFGKYGAATTYNGDNAFRNYGVFRLMFGHRGDLKTMYAASADQAGLGIVTIGRDTGGYPIDQINSQGFMNITMDASAVPGSDPRRVIGLEGGLEITGKSLSGYEDIHGWGIPSPGIGTPALLPPSQTSIYTRDMATSGSVLVSSTPSVLPSPLHMDSLGYMRNFLDDSASNLFNNAKHLSFKKVNGVSIYRSTNGAGGEGRDGATDTDTFGVGVRSLNLFDLNKLL